MTLSATWWDFFPISDMFHVLTCPGGADIGKGQS